MTERKTLDGYLPDIMREVKQLSAICGAEEAEFDCLYPGIEAAATEAAIMHCSEGRLRQWENALGIVPGGESPPEAALHPVPFEPDGQAYGGCYKEGRERSYGRRRHSLLFRFRHHDQGAYPGDGEVFLFTDVRRALLPFVPAHIDLVAEKYYSTWGDIKEGFASWGGVKAAESWNTVMNYIGV